MSWRNLGQSGRLAFIYITNKNRSICYVLNKCVKMRCICWPHNYTLQYHRKSSRPQGIFSRSRFWEFLGKRGENPVWMINIDNSTRNSTASQQSGDNEPQHAGGRTLGHSLAVDPPVSSAAFTHELTRTLTGDYIKELAGEFSGGTSLDICIHTYSLLCTISGVQYMPKSNSSEDLL